MTIAKTEAGHRVLKDRSVVLTPRQRSAFILIDGKKTAEQVLAATAASGVTREDLDLLMALGLIHEAGLVAAGSVAGAGAAATPAAATPRSDRTPQDRYRDAYPIASKLTGSLGLRGFRLNLAVEGATSYETLLALAPRIREAVGDDKFAPLDRALNG